ncbi:MAG: prenyltransferase [Candidatus Bathyarchaeota archaeon]|nr:prenyltransferase [Candidatus Bathyarchaeota archaeon]
MSQNAALNLLRVIRLHIVAGGALAFTLGALLGLAGGGSFNPYVAVLFYLMVLLGDLSTHYSNDYFDVEQDRAVESKKFFMGKRILVKHPSLLRQARQIALVLLAASILLAALAYAFKVASAELLLIVVAANLLGWFYSATPLRLVCRGLGEAAIALAAGFAIPATGYLATRGQLDGLFWLFALPFVLYGFMLALSLEAPDIEVDRKNHRRSLGARRGIRVVYLAVLAAAAGAFLWLLFCGYLLGDVQLWFWVAAALAAVPLAAAAMGYYVGIKANKPDAFSAVCIFSLFIFNALMVAYFALVSL